MLPLNHNHLFQRCCHNFAAAPPLSRPQATAANSIHSTTSSFCDSIQTTQGYILGMLVGHEDPLSADSITNFVHAINADFALSAADLQVYHTLASALKQELQMQRLHLFVSTATEEPQVTTRCRQLSNIAIGFIIGFRRARACAAYKAYDEQTGQTTAACDIPCVVVDDDRQLSERYLRDRRTVRRLAERFPSKTIAHQTVDADTSQLQDIMTYLYEHVPAPAVVSVS